MTNCKYSKKEISYGIEHELCSNEDLKKINKSNGEDIRCMGKNCGEFMLRIVDSEKETEK